MITGSQIIMIKESIPLENITILNMCVSNKITSNYIVKMDGNKAYLSPQSWTEIF